MSIRDQLTAFVEDHPDGWDHAEWVGFLQALDQQGIDVSDPDDLGLKLENTRLSWELQRRAVPGLGPKRIDAVVGRFGTLWSLRQATPDEIAEIPTIHKGLAEKLSDAL
jgi:hypothetical protein